MRTILLLFGLAILLGNAGCESDEHEHHGGYYGSPEYGYGEHWDHDRQDWDHHDWDDRY